MKIGIQGIRGSYHDKVAKCYFGDSVSVQEFLSFDDLAISVSNNDSDFGVMAIENSIAGSIIPNYALMVFPGINMKDLKFVSSHPMALLQCKNFLMKYPHITLVEEKDTADVAKQISEKKIKNTAAIASIEAAEIFGLEIISSNIQTIKNNETRFVIVSKELSKNENLIDKASLKFSLSHETGSLASVLSILKDYNLNLTKIQSLPIVEIPWKYSFFVDTTFSSIENFNDAINLINNEAESLKVLGIYKNQMK